MAYYAYKRVVYRDDFQEAKNKYELEYGYETDNDSNYDGENWIITEYLLDLKDKEIASLKERLGE